ncbi:MAG TPA: helix-turn-helix transcriptional regulator [Oxalicibacterium sp.]
MQQLCTSGPGADGQSGEEPRSNSLIWNFEELLSDLYDLSRVPDCWQRFLARICFNLNASVGIIVRRETLHEPDQPLAMYVQDESGQARLQDLCKRRSPNGNGTLAFLPMAENGGHGVHAISLDQPGPDCLLRTFGVHHALSVRTSPERQPSAHLIIGRMFSQPPFDEAELDRFGKIAPHFEWAIQLAELFAKMTANVRASTAVLDLLPTGVVILDGQGACVTMNRAAKEALDPDGSALRYLKRNLVKNGTAERNGDDPGSSPQVLSLPPHIAGHRSIAVLWDIPDDRPEQQRKLAFIMDPDHRRNTEFDVAALERIYGLTLTEARVAAFVGQNKSVAEIADQMGSTSHTVRTHLRHIFEKTGSERQLDLVHLLLQSPLVLRLPQKRARPRPASAQSVAKPSPLRN